MTVAAGSQLAVKGSIRATWWRVMALLLTIVAVMGAGFGGLARFQRDAFDETTRHFQQRLAVLASLNQLIYLSEGPAKAVLYELSMDMTPEQGWAKCTEIRGQVESDLASLDRLFAGSPLPTQARTAWSEMRAGLDEARAMWGTGKVGASLAAGRDPFQASFWTPRNRFLDTIAAATVETVDSLRTRAAATLQAQTRLEPLLLGAVVLALAACLMSGRRLSKRIIRPLLTLRESVGRIQSGNLDAHVAVPPEAGREVAELADALRVMAESLGRSQRRLRDQAYQDGLTGLANRRAMTEYLDEVFASSAGASISLLLIDLDDFKFVNDSLGHLAGDTLLKDVASRLQDAGRDSDLVARLGGDEFAIVIRGDNADHTAAAVGQRVLDRFSDGAFIDDIPVRISCSIGIANNLPDANGSEALVRNADIAMYAAKGQGKHRMCQFEPSMRDKLATPVGGR